MARCRGGQSVKSTLNVLGLLHGIFDHAIDRGVPPTRASASTNRRPTTPTPDSHGRWLAQSLQRVLTASDDEPWSDCVDGAAGYVTRPSGPTLANPVSSCRELQPS